MHIKILTLDKEMKMEAELRSGRGFDMSECV
jgi:ribosomal protein L13E